MLRDGTPKPALSLRSRGVGENTAHTGTSLNRRTRSKSRVPRRERAPLKPAGADGDGAGGSPDAAGLPARPSLMESSRRGQGRAEVSCCGRQAGRGFYCCCYFLSHAWRRPGFTPGPALRNRCWRCSGDHRSARDRTHVGPGQGRHLPAVPWPSRLPLGHLRRECSGRVGRPAGTAQTRPGPVWSRVWASRRHKSPPGKTRTRPLRREPLGPAAPPPGDQGR